MSKPKTPSRGRAASPFANPRLLLPIGLVVVVLGFLAFSWWQGRAAAAQQRQRLLDNTTAELQRELPDDGVLSKLMSGLKDQPDAKTAVDLLAAQASIELWRGHIERAYELFAGAAARPGATAAELRLGARILLLRHQGFLGDATESASMLQQVLSYSERVLDSADEQLAADLFRAWQAAERGFDHRRAGELAGRLAAEASDSAEAKLVAFLRGPFASGQFGVSQVDELPMVSPPAIERSVARTLGVLQAGQVDEAFQLANKDLLAAPGVWFVRFGAAITFHARALGQGVAADERVRVLARRDEQLDWLTARSPIDEPMRAKWSQMRAVR